MNKSACIRHSCVKKARQGGAKVTGLRLGLPARGGGRLHPEKHWFSVSCARNEHNLSERFSRYLSSFDQNCLHERVVVV
jgi:hypothetical protein